MKRILSVFLTVLLLCMPLPMSETFSEKSATLRAGDLVLFGMPDDTIGFTGVWRVLDAEQTNTGEPGILLLSEHLIGATNRRGMAFRNEKKPATNAYSGSDAKAWCEAFYAARFSAQEQQYILPTRKSDPAFSVKAPIGSDPDHSPTVAFDAAEHILDGDHVFLLSAQEACDPRYGLDTEEARIAGFGGTAANWWLRSPHDPSFPIDVGLVFYNGWLMDFLENWDNAFFTAPICMRPALNLDPAAKTLLRPVGEGKWLLAADETASVDRYPSLKTSLIRQPLLAAWIGWIAGALLLLPIIAVILIVILVRRKRKAVRKAAYAAENEAYAKSVESDRKDL